MSTTMPSTPAQDAAAVEYPDTDGQPMDGDEARELMFDCMKPLEHHFADDPQVYVSGNLPVYFVEGNNKKVIGPDALVAFGVPKHRRPCYKVWEEGKAPDWVLEIASESTWRRDLLKVGVYFGFGVREVVLFDPTGTRFEQGPLFALQREDWGFDERVPAESGRLHSTVLGLDLAVEGGELKFYDPRTGEVLQTPLQRAETAEARLKQLEDELRRLRGETD
jgi:Uma2 family endonuclease